DSSVSSLQVSPNDVLITPVQCKFLWRQFKSETEYLVSQAISAQESYISLGRLCYIRFGVSHMVSASRHRGIPQWHCECQEMVISLIALYSSFIIVSK
ncbi:hypothetical protein FRX31_006860, partial [Thalictrum thalictroides]